MNENVIVTDKKKIAEILQALQSTESLIEEIRKALKTTGNFDIKPAAPDKLPENAKKVWFGIDKP